jgi:hypothetical protein
MNNMGYWNHRVMRRSIHTEVFDAVYEVHYNEDGTVESWTDTPVSPIHYLDDPEVDLRSVIGRFLLATEKPVLDWENGQELDN